LPYAKLDAPGLPMVITETGYETRVANPYSGVNQTVQAKLTLDELMDVFSVGISHVYLYELFDEGEENFGLFNSDGSPKAAATAIHNLMGIVSDPGGDLPSSPRSLSYAVRDAPANAKELLLEKSDGTFDLVLWAEAAIWSSTAKGEIAAPAKKSDVAFGQKQKTVLVFDPLHGAMPIAVYHDVQSIQVALADHPVVVQIAPAAGSQPSSN
jgi:trimeric autotransporter adhesin